MRKIIFEYVKEKYGVEPDYPFSIAPSYPVLRHEDNRKWFALIMDVQRKKLGLDSDGRVDVINVKVSDPLLADMMAQQPGYFPGYHMSRGSWISILLDGTVPTDEIFQLIDESYANTASKRKQKKIRLPKECIIPANPKYYDIEHAFDNADEIKWKQGSGIKIGDTVFVYAGDPVSAILYQCMVTETDIPFDYKDEKLTIRALMKIKLMKRYDPEQFTFERLKDEFCIFAVRGPRGVPHSLSEALKIQECLNAEVYCI